VDKFDIVLDQANPSDAEQIYSAIHSRAQKLKSSAAVVTKQSSSPVGRDTSSSSATAAEKRSSECLADNDAAVSDKRQRSVDCSLSHVCQLVVC